MPYRTTDMKKAFLFAAVGFGISSTLLPSAHGAVDFVKKVQPILEVNCLSCHGSKNAHENGELDLTTRTLALKGGEHDTDLIPGDAEKSLIYKYTTLAADHKKVMPPKEKTPLKNEEKEILRQWIAEGANWPEGITLTNVMKVDFVRDVKPILEKGGPLSQPAIQTLKLWVDQGAVWPGDVKLGGVGGAPIQDAEMVIANDLHKKITEASKENAEGEMKKFSETISGTKIVFDMMPIPGGEFSMGSPDAEPGRKPDEGPQHKAKLDPFWMGKCEVTWDEYELFMYPEEKKKAADGTYTSESADAVTRPTKPYVEMSFGMGKNGFPAISMTQHAANKYCQWLSAKTGHFYRLPTEAEWEYACRAGTTTAYSFGDDVAQLGEYAWFGDNSDGKYQKVGKKKPNPWGLHDMHGNVVEWTLDGYDANFYKQFENSVAQNPWNIATKPYPHSTRGGSWDDAPEKLRSSMRRASTKEWKMQDPQLPKSIWFLTDAQFLGFRIVRPLKVPSPEQMKSYWNSGVQNE
ncbi:MAG: SUMF1/EgtB/PvdO family nonheme iron enzyme [Verrucomicrobiota bacterium]